jgi:hypothetical protein
MLVLIRALIYSTLFIGLVLIYAPIRLMSWSGIVRPAIGLPQVMRMVIGAIGEWWLFGA